jgi:hypothetical protein
VVEQIIEADLPELKSRLTYDSEADVCLIFVTTGEEQVKIATHLHNIFKNKLVLIRYLEKLDLSKIDA